MIKLYTITKFITAIDHFLLSFNFKMFRNMPVDLVLVRHGQSEGNLAQSLSKDGNFLPWSKDFRERHNSLYRLTDRGRIQARIAGDYIKEHIGMYFDAYISSEYVRFVILCIL